MDTLTYIILSTFLISLIAFIGVFTLSLKEKFLNKILLILVALAAGALIGGAFLHLIPESLKLIENTSLLFALTITGFVLFFIVEKGFQWHHCHETKHKIKSLAYMNLFGETIHNFIDGLIIAAAFVINIPLGITTTLAVALHEIPQEIGDFGVLIYGGYKKSRALLLNFLVALTCILGGIAGYYLSTFSQTATQFLLPIAAGGFIYIAASDLIPEIRKIKEFKRSLLSLVIFIIGILVMYLIKLI